MAGKDTKMNKKVLGNMTDTAMPFKPRTMIRLHGSDAKRFLDKKPGTKVSAQISGVIQSIGLEEYNHNEPMAEIRVTKISPSRTKKA